MIKVKTLCLIQQKKIFFYIIVVMFSFALIATVNITITNKNKFTKKIISQKKDSIKNKKTEIDKINKTISFIESVQINEKLGKKQGFYSLFDKQDFLDSVAAKMNNKNNDNINNMVSTLKSEYSGFSIKLNPVSNSDLNKIVSELKKKLIIRDEQNIRFSVETGILTVNFQADYEYVAYKILEMMKKILPGNIVVRSFSIQPVREELKRMFYIRRFDNQNENNFKPELNNRLNCTIEFEWIYLSSGEKS